MHPPSQLCDILPAYTCANRTLVPPKHTLAPLLVLFPAILLYQTPLTILTYLYMYLMVFPSILLLLWFVFPLLYLPPPL